MSLRNLTDVVCIVTDRDYHLAYADVVDAMGAELTPQDELRLRQRLEPHGLTAWFAES